LTLPLALSLSLSLSLSLTLSLSLLPGLKKGRPVAWRGGDATGRGQPADLLGGVPPAKLFIFGSEDATVLLN